MAFPENAYDRGARYGHDIHLQQVSGNSRIHNGDNNYKIYCEDVSTSRSPQQALASRFQY